MFNKYLRKLHGIVKLNIVTKKSMYYLKTSETTWLKVKAYKLGEVIVSFMI